MKSKKRNLLSGAKLQKMMIIHHYFDLENYDREKLYAIFKKKLLEETQRRGDFFFRWWVSWIFFKVTLMSLFEIQNVFMIIKNDVLDRLGHG